ncbi:hypothetical protein MMPV_005056 [Pyropia vietnamensis]
MGAPLAAIAFLGPLLPSSRSDRHARQRPSRPPRRPLPLSPLTPSPLRVAVTPLAASAAATAAAGSSSPVPNPANSPSPPPPPHSPLGEAVLPASARAPPTLGGTGLAVVWFRRDLRLDDNALVTTAATAGALLPVYVFDPDVYAGGRDGGGKWAVVGPWRATFINEAVTALRTALRGHRSELWVRTGAAAAEVAALVAEHGGCAAATAQGGGVTVLASKGVTAAEVAEEEAVAAALAALPPPADGVPPPVLRFVWEGTLLHPDAAPFPASPALGIPPLDTYVAAAATVPLPPPLVCPPVLPPPPLPFLDARTAAGTLPTPSSLGVVGLAPPLEHPFPDPRAALGHSGGAPAGAARLRSYLFEKRALRGAAEYADSGVGAPDGSSKLGAWLSAGCVSPRVMAAEVDRAAAARLGGENAEENASVVEAAAAAVMSAAAAAAAPAVAASPLTAATAPESPSDGVTSADEARRFEEPPLMAGSSLPRPPADALHRWVTGTTGVPLVDAAMRELSASGHLVAVARRVAASFWVHDLRGDWRLGAAWFRAQLIDWDPASNSVNWAAMGGALPLAVAAAAPSDGGDDGADGGPPPALIPRSGRVDVAAAAAAVDPFGFYVKRWCPELYDIPAPWCHAPGRMTAEELADFDVILGDNYPTLIEGVTVELPRSAEDGEGEAAFEEDRNMDGANGGGVEDDDWLTMEGEVGEAGESAEGTAA